MFCVLSFLYVIAYCIVESASLTNTIEDASSHLSYKFQANALYLGCFDDAYNQNLHAYSFSSAHMNPKLCIDECTKMNYSFAGLKNQWDSLFLIPCCFIKNLIWLEDLFKHTVDNLRLKLWSQLAPIFNFFWKVWT